MRNSLQKNWQKQCSKPKVMYNLFTTIYREPDDFRRAEMLYCLAMNTVNQFTSVTVLVESQDDHDWIQRWADDTLKGSELDNFQIKTIQIKNVWHRPKFNDFFDLMKPDEFNILANGDITFDPLAIYKSHFEYLEKSEHKPCYALSRWDLNVDSAPTLFDRADSQDTWVFYGKPENVNGDFCLGDAGCDNRVAHELAASGYNVLNPAHTFKTYHFHTSNVRNYIDAEGQVTNRVPPPYLLVNPY